MGGNNKVIYVKCLGFVRYFSPHNNPVKQVFSN